MSRRAISTGVVLLVASLLLVACGIPQEEHDAVVAERDLALAQSASLEADLAAKQAALTESRTQVETLVSDLESAQGDLAAGALSGTSASAVGAGDSEPESMTLTLRFGDTVFATAPDTGSLGRGE